MWGLQSELLYYGLCIFSYCKLFQYIENPPIHTSAGVNCMLTVLRSNLELWLCTLRQPLLLWQSVCPPLTCYCAVLLLYCSYYISLSCLPPSTVFVFACFDCTQTPGVVARWSVSHQVPIPLSPPSPPPLPSSSPCYFPNTLLQSTYIYKPRFGII